MRGWGRRGAGGERMKARSSEDQGILAKKQNKTENRKLQEMRRGGHEISVRNRWIGRLSSEPGSH